jgi:hypothetical protein
MRLTEAKKIVLSSYPNAFKHQWGIGRKTGTTYMIISEVMGGGDQKTLASIHRPTDHPVPRRTFEILVWKQAAFRIMRDMIQRLEI